MQNQRKLLNSMDFSSKDESDHLSILITFLSFRTIIFQQVQKKNCLGNILFEPLFTKVKNSCEPANFKDDE